MRKSNLPAITLDRAGSDIYDSPDQKKDNKILYEDGKNPGDSKMTDG